MFSGFVIFKQFQVKKLLQDVVLLSVFDPRTRRVGLQLELVRISDSSDESSSDSRRKSIFPKSDDDDHDDVRTESVLETEVHALHVLQEQRRRLQICQQSHSQGRLRNHFKPFYRILYQAYSSKTSCHLSIYASLLDYY